MNTIEAISECKHIIEECEYHRNFPDTEIRVGIITEYEEIVCFYEDFQPIYDEEVVQIRHNGRWMIIYFSDIKRFNLEISLPEDF